MHFYVEFKDKIFEFRFFFLNIKFFTLKIYVEKVDLASHLALTTCQNALQHEKRNIGTSLVVQKV